jgi:hypothetical protein
MNSTASYGGYLVVLRQPDRAQDYVNLNPRYRGANRIPYYPASIPEEIDAMEEYVFGPYRDERLDFIPTLVRARSLLTKFENSPRRFELIYVTTDHVKPPPDAEKAVELGYDVATVGGEFYSIVDDFPKHTAFNAFQNRLNSSGLLGSPECAQKFLDLYRSLKLSDSDWTFKILKVFAWNERASLV